MRKLRRPILYAIFFAGLAIALSPIAEYGYGRWQQRSLRLQWEASAQRASDEPAANEDDSAGDDETSSNYPLEFVDPSEDAAKRPVSPRNLAQPSATPHPHKPWPPTRLIIPRIGLDAVVVEGVGPDSLRNGPGHTPNSGLPGAGNCVIAAHRNMYGWWFYRLNSLQPGDALHLRTASRDFVYQVTDNKVVPGTQTGVLKPLARPHDTPRLTLYTCTLPHSTNRLVISGQLRS